MTNPAQQVRLIHISDVHFGPHHLSTVSDAVVALVVGPVALRHDQREPEAVGRGRGLELALSGESIDARRAESIGLVNRVVAPAQLDSAAGQSAAHFSSISPDALAATKRLLSPTVAWSDVAASDEFAYFLSTEAAKKSTARFR